MKIRNCVSFLSMIVIEDFYFVYYKIQLNTSNELYVKVNLYIIFNFIIKTILNKNDFFNLNKDINPNLKYTMICQEQSLIMLFPNRSNALNNQQGPMKNSIFSIDFDYDSFY